MTGGFVDLLRLPDQRPGATFVAVFLVSFMLLLGGALRLPPRQLSYSDQSFYVTIAWDILNHRVYSDGIFDGVDSARAVPPPGMFVAPVYPLLVALVMRYDKSLAENAGCLVFGLGAVAGTSDCPAYRGWLLPLHMGFLAGATALLFASARRLVGSGAVAVLAALFMVVSLWTYLRFLSLAMTESLALLLFAGAMHGLIRLSDGGSQRGAAWTGLALGLLALTRPSHALLLPLAVAWLTMLALRETDHSARPRRWAQLAILTGAMLVPVLPWVARNAMVLDRPGITAGYGPAVLAERLAYNDMRWDEWAKSFVFWLPDAGDDWARRLFGAAAVDRLDWDLPGSFYLTGQDRRQLALAAPGGADAALGGLLRDQVFANPVKHAAVTLALAWRGLWIGRGWMLVVLILAPFGWMALRRSGRLRPVLLYMLPAWIMLFLHAGASVNQERYNLALTFGFSLLSALGLLTLLARHGRMSKAVADAMSPFALQRSK